MHPVTTAPPRQSFDNHVQQYQQMPFKAPSQALHQQVNSPTYNRNGSATYALPIVTHQTTVYLPNELLPKPIEQDNVHRQISHLSPPQLLMPQPRGPQSPRYDQENIIELHRLKAENTRLKQDNQKLYKDNVELTLQLQQFKKYGLEINRKDEEVYPSCDFSKKAMTDRPFENIDTNSTKPALSVPHQNQCRLQRSKSSQGMTAESFLTERQQEHMERLRWKKIKKQQLENQLLVKCCNICYHKIQKPAPQSREETVFQHKRYQKDDSLNTSQELAQDEPIYFQLKKPQRMSKKINRCQRSRESDELSEELLSDTCLKCNCDKDDRERQKQFEANFESFSWRGRDRAHTIDERIDKLRKQNRILKLA